MSPPAPPPLAPACVSNLPPPRPQAAASASDATIAIAKTAAKTAAFVNAEDASSAVAALAAGAPADIDSVTAADVKKFAAAALKAGPSMATVGASHALPSHAAVTKMF